jgi:hypothetical protein
VAILPPSPGWYRNTASCPLRRSCQAREMPAGPPPITAILRAGNGRQLGQPGLDAGLAELRMSTGAMRDAPGCRPPCKDWGTDSRRPWPGKACRPGPGPPPRPPSPRGPAASGPGREYPWGRWPHRGRHVLAVFPDRHITAQSPVVIRPGSGCGPGRTDRR